MPSTSSNQPDQYLVHHQGQIQGPFGVDFIEAMVMSGVYPPSVIVQKNETLERMQFSNLVAAADLRPPSQKIPRSKKTKPETTVAWIVGVFGVCMVLWMINLVTSSKKPSTSSPSATTEPNIPSSSTTQADSVRPSSAGSNYAPPAPKLLYVPPVPPAPTNLFPSVVRSNQTVTPRFTLPPSQELPNTQIYRDSTGRTYRVPNAAYQRLVSMKSALSPKQSLLNAEESHLKFLSTEVDRERIYLDRTSQYSVDAFNQKINEINSKNSRVKSLVDDYNQDVDAFNSELKRVGTPIN